MSAFSSIAVLKQPTPECQDWSFQMGDLQFEVHQGMVELRDEIIDLEKFASSVYAFDALLDYIDDNHGRLDKVVCELVNHNGELAQALGIDFPYSFATEAEEKEAGESVKKAADDDDRGFFARAWDAVKRFFGRIKEMISKVWNKITGNAEQNLDKMNQETKNAMANMDDNAVNNALKGVRNLQCTPEELGAKLNTCSQIAQACNSKIPKEPATFLQLSIGGKYPLQFLGIDRLLIDLGFEERVTHKNGAPEKEFVRSKERPNGLGPGQIERKWFEKGRAGVEEFINNTSTQFKEIIGQLKYAVSRLDAHVSAIEKDQTLADKLVETLVEKSGNYSHRPDVQAITKKIGHLWWKKSVVDEEATAAKQAKVDAYNAQQDKRKEEASGKKRATVQAAMLFGKEVAKTSKVVLECSIVVETEVLNCAKAFHDAIVKSENAKVPVNGAQAEQDKADEAEKQRIAKIREEAARKAEINATVGQNTDGGLGTGE